MVHSEEEYNKAVETSGILFGKSNTESLSALDEATLLDVFDGVPVFEISLSDFDDNLSLLNLLTVAAPVFPSKGELRKLIRGGGLSVNEAKITDENAEISRNDLLQGKYLLVRKGKKEYNLLIADI